MEKFFVFVLLSLAVKVTYTNGSALVLKDTSTPEPTTLEERITHVISILI